MELSGVGIWSPQLRYGDRSESAEAAAEIEELGFRALWIPDLGGSVFKAVEHLLKSTESIVVATGILNLWMHTPAEVAENYAALTSSYGDRFLLGIGVSHAPVIEAKEPGRYRKPLAVTRSYLKALDAADPPVPVSRRVIAALGPKMLALAADHTRGSHPYLVTPDHTRTAREALGPNALLVPEQTVILCDSATEAHDIGRRWLRSYMKMPNYANNMLRSGFTAEDVASVSDRMFDAIIAWGGVAAIADRVREHHTAGANHVAIQVLAADQKALPRQEWRSLAAALI